MAPILLWLILILCLLISVVKYQSVRTRALALSACQPALKTIYETTGRF